MTTQTATTDTTAAQKSKKTQEQPKHHAGKSRAASQARRKKIIQGVLEGKPLKQIGLEVGLSPKTADNQISQILREPQTRTALITAMEKLGVNDDYLAEHHRMLLEGKKFIPARGSDSGTNSYIEVPDNQARAKGLEMAYKLTGSYTEKRELDIKRPVNVIIRKFCSPEEGRA